MHFIIQSCTGSLQFARRKKQPLKVDKLRGTKLSKILYKIFDSNNTLN